MQVVEKSILIIDDNEDMLTMLTIILRDKAYKVTARKSFDDIAESLHELRPDVVLIDKQLGDTDGLDVCRTIRSYPSMENAVILIFSAYEVPAVACREAGATAFFEKPQGMQQFLTSIEKYLQ